MNHHFHSYMDFGSLSDDELMEKITECRRRAMGVSHNADLFSSVNHLLQCMETEYDLRQQSTRIREQQQKQTETIEIGHIEDRSDSK